MEKRDANDVIAFLKAYQDAFAAFIANQRNVGSMTAGCAIKFIIDDLEDTLAVPR